jgi:hypothetical protein
MYNKYTLVAFALALTFATPMIAGAHERQLINIGGTDYLFVVGSIGEPIVVDDKTGVELRIKIADPKAPTDSAAQGAKPVEGLEQTLKVEISAGEKKKIFDLAPAYKDPGVYKAVFFPTIETALAYRLIGTINNIPVDLSFVCGAEGSVAVEDKSEVKLGEGVTRKYKNGQFGCPLAKGALGFPEMAMSIHDVHMDAEHHMMGAMNHADTRSKEASTAGIAFGLLGTLLGAIALWKSRTPKF